MVKRCTLLSILIILLGAQCLAAENLISNGDFQFHENGKPLSWSSVQAEPNSIILEGDDLTIGKLFLKIKHQESNSYSYAQQRINVQSNSRYILSGRLKTSDVITHQGGSGARILIADENGNGIAATAVFTGTVPWQDVRVEFETGNRKIITIFLYLHKASGIVWFSDLNLTCVTSVKDDILSVQRDNLLNNSGFEQHENGKPNGWSIKRDEPTAITLDNIEKTEGKTSLKINHQEDKSYSYVQQRVNVQSNSTYTLTGKIKTINVLPQSSGGGARILIADENGSGIAASPIFTGTIPWQAIKVEFETGNRKVITIYPYLHKASGTVWYDDLKLILKPQAFKEEKMSQPEKKEGVPLRFGGNIRTNVYYAPEASLKTQNYIGLFTTINVKDNSSATFYMYGLYETSGGGFETPHERIMNPWIDFLRINLTGSILPSIKPFTITIGQGEVNYSPYVATLNVVGYSDVGQGISFKDLRWNKADFSGFLLWESNKRYRDVGQGIRMRAANGPWKVESILVQHLNGNPTIKDGKIESLGIYNLMERDLQIQLERQFSNGARVNILKIEQHKTSGQDPIASINKVDLKMPIKKYQWLLSYRDFDPGFAPRYRDKTPKNVSTPRYRSFDEKLSLGEWNPVDQYKNQQGISTILSGPFLNKSARLELDHYILKTDPQNPRTNFEIELGGKTTFNLLGIYDYDQQPIRYLDLQMKRSIIKSSWGNLFGQMNFTYDKTGENNDLNFEGIIKQYGLGLSFEKGFLTGLSVNLGTQSAQERYWYAKGIWTMFTRIQVLFSYRFPNFNEDKDWWSDDLYRVHYRDNFISLKSTVYF